MTIYYWSWDAREFYDDDGEPMKLGPPVVLASDYDALRAQLDEAEKAYENACAQRAAMSAQLDEARADCNHLMLALVQSEEAIAMADALVLESLSEDGPDIGFDERMDAYEEKKKQMSDWRSRDLKLDDAASLRAQLDEARAELARWATWGTIEVAIRNPNVASYIEHWEKRALSAEAERDALRAAVEKHNAECKAAGWVCADDWLIPLPPSAAPAASEFCNVEGCHHRYARQHTHWPNPPAAPSPAQPEGKV